jgi:hypothetical protein
MRVLLPSCLSNVWSSPGTMMPSWSGKFVRSRVDFQPQNAWGVAVLAEEMTSTS